VHKSVMSVHTVVNKSTIGLLLNTGADWINFRLSGKQGDGTKDKVKHIEIKDQLSVAMDERE